MRLKTDHSQAAGSLPDAPREEAVQALAALGYSASDAMRAVKQAEGETAEELIKSALKHM